MRLLILSFLLPVVLGSALLGQEKCVWGPSYWCSHVAHARECGATNHCLQTVWKNQIIKPKSTATCTYCELIVNALKDALEDKVTEDKIASLLANACAAFPDSDIRDMCKGIITEYVPELLQMFDNDVSTDMICATVGLCSGLEDRWSPYGEKAKNNTYCSDCTKFFHDVQESITSNETLNELEQLFNQTLCSKLDGLAGICNDFLRQYLPVFLQTLADQIDPDIVCRVFGFCGTGDKQVDVSKLKNTLTELNLQGALKYRSSEECDICKSFITDINTMMENKTLQELLANEIKNTFCPVLGAFELQCRHLLDGYALEVIQMLADKLQLDPEITCQIAGLCSSDGKKVDILQRVRSMFRVKKTKMISSKVSGEECDICKDLLNQVDELLRDKTNQDKVKYELENVVCPMFGGLEDECKQLVEEYLPMLFELLVNELDPATVCETVGLCTVPSLSHVPEVKLAEPSSLVGPGYMKDSLECTVCKVVMEEVDSLLRENDTINTVEDLIDKVCKRLPTEQLTSQCEAFVKEYGQLVLSLLAKELDPKTICTELKLCSKTTVSQQKVILNQNDAKCQICILVISEIEELVANISTEDLLKDLNGVCGYLPGNLSATCVKYVTQYGSLVIDLLKSKEDPKSLCKLVTACNASHVPYMTKPIPESLPIRDGPSEECKICDTVIVMLKYILKNNSTKEEVKQALDLVCKELPAILSGPCEVFVQEEGDKIVDLITRELNASQICAELGLCKAVKKKMSAVSVVMSPYDTLPLVEVPKHKEAVKSSAECDLCNTGMGMLLSYIGENATKEEIEKEVETFCTKVPQAYQAECNQLIQRYGSQIIDYILQKLDAHTICVKIGLCDQMSSLSAVMSPYDTLPIVQPVSDKKESDSAGSDIKCEACQYIMNLLDKELQNNKSVENIKAVLGKLCSDLGELKDECTDFVNKYTQTIINFLLLDLSPDEICQELSLCPAGVRKLPEPVHVKLIKDVKGVSKMSASPECVICEFVIKEVDTILKDNKSEAAIKSALEEVCSLMPDTIREECDSFVAKYSDMIINLLVAEIDPATICTLLRLCTAQTVPSVEKIMLHTVKDTSKVDDSGVCVLCEFVIREVDTALGNNKSRVAIETAVKKVCSFFPDSIKVECISFVNKYGDTIVELLVQELDPKEICTALGVCSKQAQWGTFVRLLPEKNKAALQCELCKVLVENLQQYLKENGTKDEVEDFLKTLCDKLPDTVTAQCHDVVDQYVPAILALIDQDLKPDEICQQIGLCSNTTVAHKKVGPLFYKPQRLVGQNKCTYGPAYWCANKANAMECNAMEHCMRHVWN